MVENLLVCRCTLLKSNDIEMLNLAMSSLITFWTWHSPPLYSESAHLQRSVATV